MTPKIRGIGAGACSVEAVSPDRFIRGAGRCCALAWPIHEARFEEEVL